MNLISVLFIWVPLFFSDCGNIITFMLALVGTLALMFLPIAGTFVGLGIWIFSYLTMDNYGLVGNIIFFGMFAAYLILILLPTLKIIFKKK